jgi:hypothetical protein
MHLPSDLQDMRYLDHRVGLVAEIQGVPNLGDGERDRQDRSDHSPEGELARAVEDHVGIVFIGCTAQLAAGV